MNINACCVVRKIVIHFLLLLWSRESEILVRWRFDHISRGVRVAEGLRVERDIQRSGATTASPLHTTKCPVTTLLCCGAPLSNAVTSPENPRIHKTNRLPQD